MIIFNIIFEDEKKAEPISSFLIQKKYAFQTHVDTNKILTSQGSKQTIRLFFITKALLYQHIEQDIKNKFFSEDMMVYATPVSHVNEEYGEMIRKTVKAV